MNGRIRAGVLPRELNIAQDGAQNVVEIVRNAACKRSDGLHFLGLAQLRLQRFLLGDLREQRALVDHGADEIGQVVKRVVNAGNVQIGRQGRLRAAGEHHAFKCAVAVLTGVGQGLGNTRQVRRQHQRKQEVQRRVALFRSEMRERLRVAFQHQAVFVDYQQGQRHV